MSQDLERHLEDLAEHPHDVDAFQSAVGALIEASDWRRLTDVFVRYETAVGTQMPSYWQLLVDSLEKVSNGIAEIKEKSRILCNLGVIWESRLQRPDQGVLYYQAAFKTWPQNGEALERARDVYASDGNWKLVKRLFDVQMQVTSDDTKRVDLLIEAARIVRQNLGDEEAAEAYLESARRMAPQDPRLLPPEPSDEPGEQDWRQRLRAMQDEAAAAMDDKERAARMIAIADFLMNEAPPGIDDPAPYLRAARDLDPESEGGSHLEVSVLVGQKRWDELLELLQSDQELPDDDRVRGWIAIARERQHELEDPSGAREAVLEALNNRPSDLDALGALESLASTEEEWREVVDVYGKALRKLARGQKRSDYIVRMGEILWRQLEDMKAAEQQFKRVRLSDARNESMLRFYVVYHEDREDWRSLLTTLQNLASITEGEEALELEERMARVAEERLGNPVKAIDLWSSVLRSQPDNHVARTSVRRLLRDSGKWNRLLEFLKGELERLESDDVDERIGVYLDMVEIYEEHLSLPVLVGNTYKAILELDPAHPRAFDALAARYEKTGRWNDLIQLLEQKLRGELDDPERVAVLRRIATLWREKMDNPSRALDPLERLLELEPADPEAIDALRSVYGARGDHKKLITLQLSEAKASDDAELRDAILQQALSYAREHLKSFSAQAPIYEAIFDASGGADDDAYARLIEGYSTEEHVEDRARIMSVRLEASEVLDLEQATELAMLYDEQVEDPRAAYQWLRRILDSAPERSEAREQAITLLVRLEDWDELESFAEAFDVWNVAFERFFTAAPGTPSLWARAARVAREALGEPTFELAALEGGLSEHAADDSWLSRAADLYEEQGQIEAATRMLERRLLTVDEEGTESVYSRLIELHGERLERPGEAYRFAAESFQKNPTVEKLARLEEWASAAEFIQPFYDLLRHVGETELDEDTRAEVYRTIAQVAGENLDVSADAIDYYERLRAIHPEDVEALTELTTLYLQSGEGERLAVILTQRVTLAEDVSIRTDLRLDLAGVYDERLDNPQEAREVLEATVADAPEHVPAWARLADVLERLDVHDAWRTAIDAWLHRASVAEQADAESALVRWGLSREERDEPFWEALAARLGDAERKDLRRAALDASLSAEPPLESARLLDLARGPLSEAGRWSALSSLLSRAVADSSGETQRDLLWELSETQLERLDEPDGAFYTLGQVLAFHERDSRLFDAMNSAAADSNLTEELGERWWTVVQAEPETVETDVLPALARVLASTDRAEDALTCLDAYLERGGDADSIFEERALLLEKQEKWSELVALLNSRAQSVPDAAESEELILRAAHIELGPRDDVESARSLFRNVFDRNPRHSGAYRALQAIHSTDDGVASRIDLIESRLEAIDDEDEKIELHAEVVDLYGEAHRHDDVLGSLKWLLDSSATPSSLVPLAEGASRWLEESPERAELQSVRTEIFRRAGAWQELADVLGDRLLRAEPDGRLELLEERIEVLEQRLGEPEAAFVALASSFSEYPEAGALNEKLDELASRLGEWNVLAQAYEARLDVAPQPTLFRRLASIYEVEIDVEEQALEILERAHAEFPEDLPTLEALIARYRNRDRQEELAALLVEAAELDESQEAKRGRLLEAGRVWESIDGREDRAIATYHELLELGFDADAFDSLEGLYLGRGDDLGLAELLVQRADASPGDEERREALTQAASVYDQRVGDPEKALESLRAAVQIRSDVDVLARIDVLLESLGRHEQRVPVLEELISLSGEEPGVWRVRLASLLIEMLGDRERALGVLEKHLESAPGDKAAVRLMHGLVDDPELRDRAGALLQDAYARAGEWEGVGQALLQQAHSSEDADEKVRLLLEAARVLGEQAGDPAAAMTAITFALQAQPGNADVLDAGRRVADDSGQHQRWVETVEALAPESGESAAALWCAAAQTRLERLHDSAGAESLLRRLLEDDPEHALALSILDSVLMDEQRWEELLEVLSLRSELAENDEEAVIILHRLAAVQESGIDAPFAAIETHRMVLELDPENMQAFDALERLLAGAEDWSGLFELLRRRIELTEDSQARRALKLRVAQLADTRLGDLDAAVEALEELLADDPTDAGALELLNAVFGQHDDDPSSVARLGPVLLQTYEARGEWTEWATVAQRVLSTIGFADQLPLVRRTAQILAGDLAQVEAAWPYAVFWLVREPSDESRTLMLKSAAATRRWSEAVAALDEAAGHPDIDDGERVACARSMVAILEDELDRVEDAINARRALLDFTNDAAERDRLIQLLSRTERVEELAAALEERAVDASDSEGGCQDLVHAAWIREAHGDGDHAIDLLRLALDRSPQDAKVTRRLVDTLARAGRHQEVVELLGVVDVEARESWMWICLADALELHIDAFDAALDTLIEGASFHGAALKTALERRLRRVLADDEPEAASRRARCAGALVKIYDVKEERDALERALAIVAHEGDEDERAIAALRRIDVVATSGDTERIQEALLDAVAVPGAFDEASEVILRVARQTEDWNGLHERLESAADRARDERSAPLLRLAWIVAREGELARPALLSTLRSLHGLTPDDAEISAALEAELIADSREGELVDLLQDRLTHLEDEDERRALRLRIGALLEASGRPESEVEDHYRALLEEFPDELGAVERLEERFRARDDQSGIAEMLRVRVAASKNDDERVVKLSSLSEQLEKMLGDLEGAAEAVREAIEIQPDQLPLRARLVELYAQLGADEEERDALYELARAQRTNGDEFWTDSLLDAARITVQLGDAESALNLLDEVPLDVDEPQLWALLDDLSAASDADSAERALDGWESRAAARDDHERLVAVLDRRLQSEERREGQAELLESMATIARDRIGDADRAVEWFGMAALLAADPTSFIGELVAAATTATAASRAVELVREIADVASDEDRAAALERGAELAVERLDDREQALELRLAAFAADPSDDGLAERTAEALSAAHRWQELAELLLERFHGGHGDHEATRDQLVEILHRRLGETPHAARLAIETADDRVLSQPLIDALEAALDIEELAEAAMAKLEPHYRDQGPALRLAELLERRLMVVPVEGRAAIASELVEVYRDALADRETAFLFAVQAVEFEPGDGDRWSTLRSVASGPSDSARIVALIDEMSYHVEDEELMHQLLVEAAERTKTDLADPSGGETFLLRALDAQPSSQDAFDGLVLLYESSERNDDLESLLIRRSGYVEDDLERAELFLKASALAEGRGEFDRAADLTLDAISLRDGEVELYDRASRILQQACDWSRLVGVLEQKCELVYDEEVLATTQLEMGRVLLEELGDTRRAIEAFTRVMELDPSQPEAGSQLLVLLEGARDWEQLREVATLQLDHAATSERRRELLELLARVDSTKLNAPDRAIESFYRLLDEWRDEIAYRDRLEALLERLERWGELVESLTERLDPQDDPESQFELRLRIAELAVEQLDAPGLAETQLNELVELHPEHPRVLGLLASILASQGRADEGIALLEKHIGLVDDVRARATLFGRLGALHEAQSGVSDVALRAYRQSYTCGSTQPAVLRGIIRCATELSLYDEAFTCLAELADLTADTHVRLGLIVERADFARDLLNSPSEEVVALEQAVDLEPDDSTLSTRLVRALLSQGRAAEAMPIVDRWAEAGRKAPAEQNYLRGRVLQLVGDIEGAIEAHQLAFRADTSNIENLMALGHLQLSVQDANGALRFLQTALLHQSRIKNAERKAELFHMLGVTHRSLGDETKAREMFRRSLSSFPGYEPSRLALEN